MLIFSKIYKITLLQAFICACGLSVCMSQNIQTDSAKMSLNHSTIDTLANDSTLSDSTATKMRISPNAITSIVNYSAIDSLTFDVKNNKAYLHNGADLSYEDFNLKAYEVELDFKENEMYAKGTPDTSGKSVETPVFKQGESSYHSEELRYNFDTKKGLIKNVITQQDESYLHGDLVKKDENNNSFIKKGAYTTCNLADPHFEAYFGKAKVIPNDKIVTGPVGVKVCGIPLPIGLPFGFFPMNTKHQNGFLMPSPGMDDTHGFYFKGFGYYFSIKDRVDFAITADLYTRGSFGAGLTSNYAKRYKFTGNINLHYDRMVTGVRKTKEFAVSNNFLVSWKHQQSAKAHPTNRFSASVSFQNSSYNKNTVAESISAATKAATTSSISFSTSWKTKFSLGINAELTQNLSQKSFNLKLPYINFGISQFYPLRRKKVVGKLRWYENISMQYTLDMTNSLSMTYDSTTNFLSKQTLEQLRYGVRHSIPIKSTIKILKHITWTNTINFTECWQFVGVHRNWHEEIDSTGRHYGVVVRDTTRGFFASHDLTYNTYLSTRLYGMYILKKGPVIAFRHEFAPSISFNYKPGINKAIYDTYYDQINHNEVRYSLLDGMLYGVPAYKTSACINFALSNKLEMKVKDKKTGGTKKVTILENVTLSTGYDFAADSLRWKTLDLTGRTTFLRTISLAFSFAFDPYSIDTNGRRCKITELKDNHRLFRMSSTVWSLSLGYTINQNTFRNRNNNNNKAESPSGFGDWNINISYNLTYNLSDNYYYYMYYGNEEYHQYDHTFRNIINVKGDFALTPKWGLRFSTGYDFTQKVFSATEIAINRDLHCWKMELSWIPFGIYRRIEFTFAAKANILKDVKYPYKKDFRD